MWFQIDGTFRINTPAVLLGYTFDARQAYGELGEATIGQNEDVTYLSLFITIEPPLILPEPMRERVRQLIQLCKHAVQILKKNCLF